MQSLGDFEEFSSIWDDLGASEPPKAIDARVPVDWAYDDT
jgi:hypothetical protein